MRDGATKDSMVLTQLHPRRESGFFFANRTKLKEEVPVVST